MPFFKSLLAVADEISLKTEIIQKSPEPIDEFEKTNNILNTLNLLFPKDLSKDPHNEIIDNHTKYLDQFKSSLMIRWSKNE